MDIAEKGRIAYDAVSVNFTQNIPMLIESTFREIEGALLAKMKASESKDSQGSVKINLHALVSQLVSRSTALSLVGSELCETGEWLQTALGYARDVGAVQRDLGPYWKFTWPFIVPFLTSCRRLKSRYATARKILRLEIERRRGIQGEKYQEKADMLQWLIKSSKGSDASVDMIARRMLFLSFASIDTTSITCTNVLLDLLARPEQCNTLREEWNLVCPRRADLDYEALKAMRVTDSFMKESQRMNPMGLVTFNRQIAISLQLSNGTLLPAGTYISVPQWPVLRDPEIYDQPTKFDPLRFVHLREKDQNDFWSFASHNSNWPGWDIGKFSCPGRYWASVQIKLVLIAILDNFDICFPDGQVGRPENNVRGESVLPDSTQSLILTPRGVPR